MAARRKKRRASIRTSGPQHSKKSRKKWNSRASICTYCKRPLTTPAVKTGTSFTLDHVMPRALGGTKTVPCCLDCNRMKADLHPSEWRWVTENYPGWWKLFDPTKPVKPQLSKGERYG